MSMVRGVGVCLVSISLLGLPGCKSKDEKALEQAKQQAAATGQPQQIVSVDRNGNATTTVVQPPVPGQSGQVVTTTTTSAAAPASVAPPAGAVASNTPAPAPGYAASGVPAAAPAQPVPGGAPVITPIDLRVPAGTGITIRINQHISVKTTQVGERFDGEVADAIADPSGRILVPQATPVSGVVDAAHRRGHFKGRSILELRLTTMTLEGRQYSLDTRDLTRTRGGKGKRSAAFIGGGAGLGMLVGGVASGGVGLLVGGLSGAGAGTAIAGLTGNRDLDIPAESIMRFRLAQDLVINR